MRVFGIDCGTEFTGYGVVEMDHTARNPALTHCAAGTIRLNKKEKTRSAWPRSTPNSPP